MKKIAILGCLVLFVFCAPKKTTVKTEGLEEVVVFGEETINVSEEPVLPTPTEVVTPPPSEEVTPPPITEETVPPPLEEIATLPPPPVVEITPPPITEETVPLPPLVEEITLAPPPIVTPTLPPAPTPAPTPTSAQIYGFRVQIFASSTQKNAERVADDARSSFGGKIYVEYVAPYYKVRIGDCLTSEDAQVLKNKALKLGYRGAFIVETMISP